MNIMKTFTFILAAILILLTDSQSQWIWQNPAPQGNTVYNLQFLNSNTGFGATGKGTILKTTNGGLNWSILRTGSDYATKSVYFVNVSTGYAVADLQILKTTNAGINWQVVQNTAQFSYAETVTFLNENTGYVTCRAGKIYKTTNAGLNWEATTPAVETYFTSFFFDSNTGFVAGYWSTVRKTTNGGVNWVSQYSNTSTNIHSIFFTNTNTGYFVTNNGSIRKTTNSGTNWDMILSSGTTDTLNSVYFIDQYTGFIAGSSGRILKTTNEGNSWNSIYTGIPRNLLCVKFADSNTGYVSGEAGLLYKTTNTGGNWTQISSGYMRDLKAIRFLNINTGYAAGDSGFVFKTTNAGMNWFELSKNTNLTLNSLYFNDVNTGYAVGFDDFYGTVLKTTNAGLNWSVTNTSPVLHSVFFTSYNTGYAVGPQHSIYKTINAGNSWSWIPINLSLQYNLNSICFTSTDVGYAVGYNGEIIKTTNAGSNWTQINLGITNVLMDVHFVNENTGYITGNNGTLIKTTNAGNTWSELTSGTTSNLSSISFINEYTGYISGANGNLLKTTNSGVIWTNNNPGSSNNLSSVCNDGSGNVYVAGNFGNILKLPSPLFTITGTIRYADNNQPVNSGKVKAVKFDAGTHQPMVIDSAQILPNGDYTLINIPQDSIDIMAFDDDEEYDFVPTYYPSTISWQNAVTLYASSSLTGIDISVFRNSSSNDNKFVSGNVNSSFPTDITGLKWAVVYAKSGSIFKGYSVTSASGNFSVDKLSPGNYELIVDCLGYNGETKNIVVGNNGTSNVNFTLQGVIGINPPETPIPFDFSLIQNYPNPFNPITVIKFFVPHNALVKLTVYDLQGKEIKTLTNERKNPGIYEVNWNASEYSSGIYFYELVSEGYRETKKMVLLK
jgi:photosystem II stability/assembly factor-like uncharacterized protein